MSQEAANKNSAVLAELNYDFTLLYKKFSSSPLAPGSEFRPPQVLEPLLSRHPLWPTVSEMLAEGLVLPLLYISSEDRQADLDFHRQRGNHKSAVENTATLKRLLLDDVIHGYSLPLSIDSLAHIRNASLAPLGCHEQKTIDEHGNIVPKWRMCHVPWPVWPQRQPQNQARGATPMHVWLDHPENDPPDPSPSTAPPSDPNTNWEI